MALTKVTGQVIKNTTDVTVGVLTVTNTLAVGGTVSIGGTLTYEDVTNVDAVGLITARNGIVVGSGITLSKDGDGFFTGVTTTGSLVSSGAISGTTGNFSSNVDVAGELTVAETIAHTGDTNNKISFPSADTIALTTAGGEALRVDSSQRLLIGTTTEGNAAADKLTINTNSGASGMTIRTANDSNANIFFSDGTSGAAEYAGFVQYAHATDHLALGANGSERVRIDSNGALQMNGGSIQIDGTGEFAVFETDTSLSFNNSAQISLDFSSNVARLRSTANGSGTNRPLALCIGSSEKLRIASDGNIGIGENSPSNLLHVKVSDTGVTPHSSAQIVLERSGTNYLQFLTANDGTSGLLFGDADDNDVAQIKYDHNVPAMQFLTETGERLRIDAYGRILIGTTSTVIASSADFAEIVLGGRLKGAGITLQDVDSNVRFQIRTDDDASGTLGTLLNASTNHDIFFRTNNTERLRIKSDGKLLVGTTSGGDTYAAIRAKQGVAINSSYSDYLHGCYEAQITINSGGQNKQVGILNSWDGNIHATSIATYYNGGYGMAFAVNDDTSDRPIERATISKEGVASFNSTSHVFNATTSQAAGGSSYYCYRGHHSGGTISFNVWSNGNVQNTNNSYSSISDVKLKENIVDANSQWSDIKALKIRNYNFKAETKHETHTQIGVIAQELETVCPKLVTEIPDVDSDGKDLGTTTKTVNYSVLNMKAIKCLQEAITKIETLEAEVAALKG